MFYAVRVSNQIRKAMRAVGVTDQVRNDYATFVRQMVASKAKHKEIELLDRADAAGMSVPQGAYEALIFEYQIAEKVLNTLGSAEIATHPRMFDNVLFAIATTAALLAQGNGVPAERLLSDFPLLKEAVPTA